MIKKILVSVLGFIDKFVPSWVPKDKFYHFVFCFIGAFIEGQDPRLTIGLAIGKEIGDTFNKESKWDWLDVLADTIGILFGIILREIYNI